MPERLWWQGRLAALDLETTGPEPETARVVQAALIRCGGGEPTETFTTLVDPLIDIPEGATNVHGVTTAQAQAEGVKPDAFLSTAIAFLGACRADGVPVCIFNASYDLTVILAECARHDIAPPLLPHVLDAFVMDAHVSYRKGSRKLAAQCEFYGVRIDRAHDAGADAIAAARVVYAIARKYPTIGNTTLAEMQDKQREWAATRAASLQAYFDKTGKTAKVDPSWPVRSAA